MCIARARGATSCQIRFGETRAPSQKGRKKGDTLLHRGAGVTMLLVNYFFLSPYSTSSLYSVPLQVL